MQEQVDPPVLAPDLIDDGGDCITVGQVDAVVPGHATRPLDGLDGHQGRDPPLDPGEFTIDQHRGRTIAALLDPRREVVLQPALVPAETGQVGVRRIGGGGEVEQVEHAAADPGQVGRDGGDDAARRAGDDEDAVRSEDETAVLGDRAVLAAGRERPLDEPDTPPLLVAPADLDGTRVAQGLIDEDVGDRRGLPAGGEVDALHQGLGLLLLVRLGEAADRAAHRSGRARVVIAVVPAEAGGRDEERARVVQRAHRGVERLDATP